MTKLGTDSDMLDKCDNCGKKDDNNETNRESMSKINENQLKEEDNNELKNIVITEGVEECDVRCCGICGKNISSEDNSSAKQPIKNSTNTTNTYGSINPVVVINIFKDEDPHIGMGGVINEAFLNEDDTRYDLKIIPEVEEEDSIKNQNIEHLSKGELPFRQSWRTSSKRSMSSMLSHISHNSSQFRSHTPSRRRSSAVTSNASEKRRDSIRTMLFGDPGLSLRRFSQDIRNTYPNENKEFNGEIETYKVIFLQVFLPFLIAGFGNVGAGLILDSVQHWDVFKSVSELFILIASFLGFKGNLEMTLAARLSTQANLGNLDKPAQQWGHGIGNIVLIQCQAIVVALLAALFAVAVNTAKDWQFQLDHCLLICATSLITASVTGFFLASLMIAVIILARKAGVNPDNCSTLIAAFLGDISAVIMLAGTAKLLFEVQHIRWIAPAFILIFIAILPFLIILAKNNEYTRELIHQGWYPIIIAMFISSIGGFIFDLAVSMFETIAIFQPIINGVGSNLVAVQASRISTYLHQRCSLGEKPPNSCKVSTKICQSPHNVFIGTMPFLWTKKIDPDNSAIPGIMAMGDLIGTALLTIAYMVLVTIGDPNTLSKQIDEYYEI
ncbi:solute carrier family 41 member 1-like [Oppia nitens]|uniref:solute carrier family 41 member 1-like n=1 Tax=Oppia nitens TaxID=1686743 RepID=UPI0023DA991E|nr:solute carrier family 41 member 1-like [Oppia nitens]